MLDFKERDFSFIGNLKYREILKKDYAEAIKCINNQSYKSVVILSGSIIESILSDYKFQNDENTSADKVYKMQLNDLIKYAVENNLIRERASQLSHVIRNFRNLIHPGRLIRVEEIVDSNLAIAAFGVMNIILSDIKESYEKQYKHDGKTIYEILVSDSDTLINIDSYMSKMNKSEKVELLKLVLDLIATREDNHAVSFYKARSIYNQISEFYDDDTLKIGAEKLYNEVVKGNGNAVINLFNSLGDKLNLLQVEHKDDILKYLYNKTCLDQMFISPPYPYVNDRRLYQTLGKYHDSKVEKELYYKTLINLILWYDSDSDDAENCLAFYKRFTQSLTEVEKVALKNYLNKKTQKKEFEKFFYDLDPSSKLSLNDDDLPF